MSEADLISKADELSTTLLSIIDKPSESVKKISEAMGLAEVYRQMRINLNSVRMRANEDPIEFCRECRDEANFGAPGVPAIVILWGKLFPPEALGPKCYDHAVKHLGHAAMSRLEGYAVLDLRTLRRR